jgi:hypothetical protein
MLRFLGYVKSQSLGCAFDFSIFRSAQDIQKLLQEFCNWLYTSSYRNVTFGTIASYCNSLLTLSHFAIGEIHNELDEECDDLVVTSLFNLRSQSERKQRDDAHYRPRNVNWISWEDAHRSRLAAKAAFHAEPNEKTESRIKLGEEVALSHLVAEEDP